MPLSCVPVVLSTVRVANGGPVGPPYRLRWQVRPQYRNIVHRKTLHAVIDCIHANPVRRGLVERPTDWTWSSARFWDGWPDAFMRVDQLCTQVQTALPLLKEQWHNRDVFFIIAGGNRCGPSVPPAVHQVMLRPK
jgi:hypothetical protein